MKIHGMIVNKFDEEETDLVFELTFNDKRDEIEGIWVCVPVQDNEFTGVIAEDTFNEEITLSEEEKQQIMEYAKKHYKAA